MVIGDFAMSCVTLHTVELRTVDRNRVSRSSSSVGGESPPRSLALALTQRHVPKIRFASVDRTFNALRGQPTDERQRIYEAEAVSVQYTFLFLAL